MNNSMKSLTLALPSNFDEIAAVKIFEDFNKSTKDIRNQILLLPFDFRYAKLIFCIPLGAIDAILVEIMPNYVT